MKSFSNYISNKCHLSLLDFLVENRVVNFGSANPNYNQCVILAGGAASGKGTIQQKIDITGKVFDVDELKKQYLKMRHKFNDDKDYDMADPDDTAKIHEIVKQYGWKDKTRSSYMQHQENVKNDKDLRLGNVIYDIVCDDIKDLEQIAYLAKNIGYNVTIVWVVTNTDVAKINNACRGIGDKKKRRRVPDAILEKGHKGAHKTMSDFFNNKYEYLNDYVDAAWVGFGSGIARIQPKKYIDSPVRKIKKSNDGYWNFDQSMVDDYKNLDLDWDWETLDLMKDNKIWKNFDNHKDGVKDDEYGAEKFEKICSMSKEVSKHYNK